MPEARIDDRSRVTEEQHPGVTALRHQRAQRGGIAGAACDQPQAEREMVAQEREAGAQKQEERRIEECQIAPAGVAMQCQLQQPMRLADVGLRRMAIERQLPGGPEADEIARKPGNPRRGRLPLHPQHAEAQEGDQRQRLAGDQHVKHEPRSPGGCRRLERRYRVDVQGGVDRRHADDRIVPARSWEENFNKRYE